MCLQPSIYMPKFSSQTVLQRFFLNNFEVVLLYREDTQELCSQNNQNNQNRFIPLSEGVVSCAAHPLYHAIVTGTKVRILENSIIFSFVFEFYVF